MIFSLLNVRKKTAATIAGIAIGAVCLWGLAMWQDVSITQLANILLAILLLLGGIMLAALLVISCFKVSAHLVKLALHNRGDDATPGTTVPKQARTNDTGKAARTAKESRSS